MEIAIACNTCGMVQRMQALAPGTGAECCRCGSVIRTHGGGSLERTAALSLAALIFFLPANVYPILRMNYYGAYSESTVWGGCVTLFQQDERLVALIVFLASMAIPFTKLLGLFYLVVTTRLGSTHRRRERLWIYKFIDTIGPWAMLDVFLLSVLVALVKLKQLATVLPGPGLFAFTAVVVLTILASASFDPRLLWERPDP